MILVNIDKVAAVENYMILRFFLASSFECRPTGFTRTNYTANLAWVTVSQNIWVAGKPNSLRLKTGRIDIFGLHKPEYLCFSSFE